MHLTANLQKKITETLIVLYQSDINRETAVFQDDLTDSTAYLHYGEFDVFNDAEWQDSMYFFTANQQMGVQLNKRKMSMAMMLNFQPSEMWWRNSKIYFNEWSSEMFFQYFRFKAQGKYVFNGYNAGANQVKISYGNLLRDSSKFQWKIQLVRITQKPSVMAYWHSDITKYQEVIKGKAELYWHPYNTGLQITYRNDKNKAYLYSDGNFYQADGQLLQITLRQPFYYKFAGLDNNLQHNRSLGAFDVYRLPEWILSSHIFFRYHLFKKKINFTTGIKVSWFSQAYLNTWNPVYRNYMLQNNSIQGNYPVLDFLFTAQIKTFKAFVNILHINDGFTGNNYYLLPQYPVYGRWFQAGIQWIFLD
ncbi:MAG: hypothetical protein D6707_00925 [Bacteroidetes bacterium]|nr:MAG: hypothetical protein D6707_00925 [Bacteroidota bacterium]